MHTCKFDQLGWTSHFKVKVHAHYDARVGNIFLWRVTRVTRLYELKQSFWWTKSLVLLYSDSIACSHMFLETQNWLLRMLLTQKSCQDEINFTRLLNFRCLKYCQFVSLHRSWLFLSLCVHLCVCVGLTVSPGKGRGRWWSHVHRRDILHCSRVRLASNSRLGNGHRPSHYVPHRLQ